MSARTGVVRQRSGWRALNFEFTIQASDARVLETAAVALSGLASAGRPASTYGIARDAGTAGTAGGWALTLDSTPLASATDVSSLLTRLIQDLNVRATASWDGPVCHAGCVARGARAVVLPADPESGKTTLTCGLVRAGFDYVTDEGVAFTPASARIEPYPKPMSLDPGSWYLFPELEPATPAADDGAEPQQWQVPAGAIRPDAVSGTCEARFIVFPSYVEGACTEIVPMRRAEALVELAKNTFDFNRRSREYLEQLEVVVRACDCYRMTVGDLGEAIVRVEDLFADG